MLLWQPIFCRFYPHNWVLVTFGRWRLRTVWVHVVVHGCRWTQVASGAAGRANAGLCLTSSLISSWMSNRSIMRTPATRSSTATWRAESCISLFGRIACTRVQICGLLLPMFRDLCVRVCVCGGSIGKGAILGEWGRPTLQCGLSAKFFDHFCWLTQTHNIE